MERSKSKTINIQADVLKALYYENKDLLRSEADTLQDDITELFEIYIEDKISSGELLNIAITGEVAGSKSTSGCKIKKKANDVIRKKHKKVIDEFKTIFSDQTEFVRFINTEEQDVCVLIDEFSRVAEIGLNATTEMALFDYYTEVFAQKHVHRISCSPSVILDKTATVILDYLGKDTNNFYSKFKLSYRNPSDGYNQKTLGFIHIYVGDIIEEDWYKKYRKKKFDRMELLDKHGVKDIRELEFSDVIIDTVEDLKAFVVDGNKTEMNDMINSAVIRFAREKKKIYSYLTLGEINSRCRNILNIYAMFGRITAKLNKCKKEDFERLMIKKKKIEEVLDREINEEVRKLQIYKKFLDIK